MTTIDRLLKPISDDIQAVKKKLAESVCLPDDNLSEATEEILSARSKKLFRPSIILLISRALSVEADATPAHLHLAATTEIMHTASLIHDDIIDKAFTRRGLPTLNSSFDSRSALFIGNFLFGQSSFYLAKLDNIEVVALLSQVLTDYIEGEVRQAKHRYNVELTFDQYLQKTYEKTASIFANSSKASCLLAGASQHISDSLFHYGKNLGLAFQIADDILDFTSSEDVLGKPACSDLASGNLTAPTLYAMQEGPLLKKMIARRFCEERDLEVSIDIVKKGRGIARARHLADRYIRSAELSLSCLHDSPFLQSLVGLARYSVERLY